MKDRLISVDRITIQQVIGCLMREPSLVAQKDKYNLSVDDFTGTFERSVFSAIELLYDNGARIIDPINIYDAIQTNGAAQVAYNNSNGTEYLNDAKEFAQIENFGFYYQKLKKFNLLRDLQKQNFDTSIFYSELELDSAAAKINQRFEELSVEDICKQIRKVYSGLENKYLRNGEVEIENVEDGYKAFLRDLDEEPNIGAPIQGRFYSHIINGAERKTLTIRAGSSGSGKALPNSTRIPTPTGWKEVGEIQVGDYLFDAFGKPTKVLKVYPQGKKEVWQVSFKDGRTARCCDEHLWSYNTVSQKSYSKRARKFYTKTLKEIMQEPLQNDDGSWRILVPQQYAVEYQEKEHYLPPYIMGLCLGDGSFRQNKSNKAFQFSSETDELPNVIGKTMNWIVKKSSIHNFAWHFGYPIKPATVSSKQNVWVEELLKEHPQLINTKSEDKYIPREYLEDSIEHRFELLNGLLDTDGSVDSIGRITYYTVSPRLRDDVIELSQSLGFKASYGTDTHKNSLPGYYIGIVGRPQDKVKLFKMKRKKKLIQDWYNNQKRKEGNEHNAIVDIQDLGYREEMTCFYVDNEEHLFLTEGFNVTHNTRNAMADACFLAYPIHFDSSLNEWVKEGGTEKVLFIITEQTMRQAREMIMAYLTDINSDRFRYGKSLTSEERERIKKAELIIKQYNNLILMKVPNPTISSLQALIRDQVLLEDFSVVFYDYIYISPELLGEFKGSSLRNDELLLLMSNALKNLAVELDIAIFTSTQVNANADDNRDIRNEASLAGGRATINKADNGAILARPKADELKVIGPVINTHGGVTPNLVTDVFKVRSGRYTQVRVWSYVNLGTLKRKDLFVTDALLNTIDDITIEKDFQGETRLTDDEIVAMSELMATLNEKGEGANGN